jgi:hypothetical protein
VPRSTQAHSFILLRDSVLVIISHFHPSLIFETSVEVADGTNTLAYYTMVKVVLLKAPCFTIGKLEDMSICVIYVLYKHTSLLKARHYLPE